MRGVGGNSAALGVQQGDAIRNITAEICLVHGANFSSGAASFGRLWPTGSIGTDGSSRWSTVDFDASRIVPVANENRPVNMAVRYLIRARP